jgi:uncharacterized protein YcaQ
MPMLWRDEVIGWGNLSMKDGDLKAEFGYVAAQPQDRNFRQALEEELSRMRFFLRSKLKQ